MADDNDNLQLSELEAETLSHARRRRRRRSCMMDVRESACSRCPRLEVVYDIPVQVSGLGKATMQASF